MATFRAGKLSRKNNGHFRGTEVKSRTENFLDSRERESSDSLTDAKVSFHVSAKSRGRHIGLGLLSKELADDCNYYNVSFNEICEHLE